MAGGSDTGGQTARDRRIGEVLNEFMDRRARGENPSPQALLSQHPKLADELREHLRLLGELRGNGDQIRNLMARGILAACPEEDYAATLGPYKIIEYIGRGGMGIVLKAFDPSLKRSVAIKVLRPDLADDDAVLSRFEREARAAAALRHPNIVTVHAVGQDRGVRFIVMEYVDGPSLAEVIGGSHQPSAISPQPSATGRQPSAFSLQPEIVRHVFRQLLEALGAAHAAGLIHRDVKPSNILLDRWSSEAVSSQPSAISQSDKPAPGGSPQSTIRNPQSAIVKLADFGLARMRSSQTQLTLKDSILGTPEYMSPEQARGDENIDHRTDLYSAGAVLYEMLAGTSPFKADSPTATLHGILTRSPRPPQQTRVGGERALADLALRLMEKQPNDRFQSAKAALDGLEAGSRIPQPTQRRRMRRIVTATAVILLLCLGLVWAGQRLVAGLRSAAQPESTVPTAAWVDERDEKTVLVRRGYDTPARILRSFGDEVLRLRSATLFHSAEGGVMGIAVAAVPRRPDANVLFLDAEGRTLWTRYLTTDIAWPDCVSGKIWQGAFVAECDVDGRPGNELIATTQDTREFPSRISVVDPETGAVGATYWHMGQIKGLSVAPNFFGPGHSALLVWGVNNKLDGFDQPLPGDSTPCTDYDLVSVAMILDPRDMEGLGPPRTSRVPGIPPANPYAYAFLDWPPSIMAASDPRNPGLPEETKRHGFISATSLSVESEWLEGGNGPRLALDLSREDGKPGPGILLLDRDLNVLDLVRMTGQTESIDGALAFWTARWRPLFQHGRPVSHCAGLAAPEP